MNHREQLQERIEDCKMLTTLMQFVASQCWGKSDLNHFNDLSKKHVDLLVARVNKLEAELAEETQYAAGPDPEMVRQSMKEYEAGKSRDIADVIRELEQRDNRYIECPIQPFNGPIFTPFPNCKVCHGTGTVSRGADDSLPRAPCLRCVAGAQ